MQILQLLYMEENGVRNDLYGIGVMGVVFLILLPVINGIDISYRIWKRKRKKC